MPDLPLLPHARCQEIFDAARRCSAADEIEVMLTAGRQALTRFANNVIHQNVEEETAALSVRVVVDHKTARATTNRFDTESIRRVVEEATALARVQSPDADLPPMAEPGPVPVVDRFDAGTAETTPASRAEAVGRAVRVAEHHSLTAAGIFATGGSVEAILNSRGLFVYHPQSRAEASITMMGADSSGWAKAGGIRTAEIDLEQLAARAASKAVLSRAPITLHPGVYPVVLEPAAVLDLLGFLVYDFSATAIGDQRSFLTGRLGQKLFGENITVRDDVCHPLQSGAGFDGEGVGRRPLTLIERGVAREVAYCRQAAHAAGREPTGHGFPLPNEFGEAPLNIVVAGGEASLDQMIRSTGRGVLVTRLWYIREVDPYEKILTGMTRDGTFLIEHGEVRAGLRNFRFNQSMIELLNSVEMLSPAGRASGEEAFDMVTPAMKAGGFHFTELTKF